MAESVIVKGYKAITIFKASSKCTQNIVGYITSEY